MKKTSEETTYLQKTICYILDIDGKKVEIVKHFADDMNCGCSFDVEWNFIEDKDQEWFDNLDDEPKDLLEDFISDLG